MSTDTSDLLASLARARGEFEARLQQLPQWRALAQLDKDGAGGAGQAPRRDALIAELKGNPLYQGWVDIGTSMAMLAAAVAPVAAAAAEKPQGPPDDLKRIRGIGQQQAVALHRLGVRRFVDIARWSAADVARVSQALGLTDEISRQNWIEQAAARHLGQGGRLDERAPVTAAPVAARVEAAPVVPVPIPVATAPARAAHGADTETVQDDLTRIRGIRPPIAEALGKLGVTRFADIANWTAADVARIAGALGLGDRISRESWIEQAAMRVPASALRVAAPVTREATPMAQAGAKPAAVAEPVAPSAAAVAEPAPDELTRIRGVRPAVAEKLKGLGVTTFEAIANWTAGDVQRISAALGLGDRISREGWIEQAAARVLAQGGKLSPVMQSATGRSEGLQASVPASAAPVPARAERASEGSPAAAVAAAPPAAEALAVLRVPAAAPPVPPTFASALAAIKAGLSAPVPVAAAVIADSAANSVAAPTAALPDRLERIAGIDAWLAKKLNVLGAVRFADIAAWSAADVKRIETALGRPGVVSGRGWIEQAAVLARGGVTAHAALIDRGLMAALAAYPPQPLAPVLRQTPPQARPVAVMGSGAPPVPPIEARMAPPPAGPPVAPASPVAAGVVTAAVTPPPQARATSAVPVETAAADAPRVAAGVNAGLTAPPAPIVAPAPAASPQAAQVTPRPAASAVREQWPSMTNAPMAKKPAPVAETPVVPAAAPALQQARPIVAAPAPAAPLAVSPPVRQAPPPADVNAMPGPADPVPARREARSVEARADEAQKMEGGLAAALAAAAATASAGPRLVPGQLGEQIRMLPGAADPYLEDLSDWVQDTAEEFAVGAVHSVEVVGEEAAVAIVRAAAAPGDLGALTPGTDGVFDGASYAAYRRHVGEASVDIVRSGGLGGDVPGEPAAGPTGGAAGQPERGLRRLMRAIRGDPKGR